MTAREALSARIDGEREPVPAGRVDEHLETCPECCAWYAAAAQLSRGLSVRAAHKTPDLTVDILAAVGVDVPRSPLQRATRWVGRDHRWRAALIALGIMQVTLGLTQLLGVDAAMVGHSHTATPGAASMSTHLFNESTAWNLAVGVGFVVAGIRTHATTGLLPVLTVFTAVLTVFVVTDSISGNVTASRIASHAIIAAGVLVTVVVHRRYRDEYRPPPRRAAPPAHEGGELQLPPGAKYGRRRGHLRDATDPAA
ncbi:zf-HC2 domain-containing protein [Rhodococcus wratislaviensis]|uniref:zf-HC2 domain-containing protein n=1 Tax=Rhodococcus wratislaviensis TaxID=44752 RepID=UPI00365D09EB